MSRNQLYAGLASPILQRQFGSSNPDIHPNVPAPPIQCFTVAYSPIRRNRSSCMKQNIFPSARLACRCRTIWYRSVGTAIPNEQKYRCSSNSRGWLSMSLLMYLERYRASLTGEEWCQDPFIESEAANLTAQNDQCRWSYASRAGVRDWLLTPFLPPENPNDNLVSSVFDQLRARSSRTPRPILRRMSVRSVTPSA